MYLLFPQAHIFKDIYNSYIHTHIHAYICTFIHTHYGYIGFLVIVLKYEIIYTFSVSFVIAYYVAEITAN